MTKLFNPALGNRDFYALKKDEWLNPFDRLFDEMMSAQNPELHRVFGDSLFEKNAYPKVNIIDRHDSVLIEASVPGLKKEDVSIESDGQTLTISSSFPKEMREEGRGLNYLRREIKKSSFARSFILSRELDIANISADMDSGLLLIMIPKLLPKKEVSSKKKIEIRQQASSL